MRLRRIYAEERRRELRWRRAELGELIFDIIFFAGWLAVCAVLVVAVAKLFGVI